MDKDDFLVKLQEETGYSSDTCFRINEILESYFLVGKSNKEKIEKDFKEKLSFSEEESENIYNKVMDIFANGVKNKIKHPFDSKE